MDNNSKNKNLYSFPTNQPLGEDLLGKNIAQVISEKIVTDPTFKIIGIEGQWGSGKRNLVRFHIPE